MQEEFFALIAKHDMQRFSERLLKETRESIRLVPDAERPSRRGGTRLGGLPDLPPDAEWPTYGDKPLSFIAQVNLAELQAACQTELRAASPVELLPADGMLWFFYDNQTWGFDPRDRGSARVIHRLGNEEDLVEREPPGTGEKPRWFGLTKRRVTGAPVYKACALDFDPVLTLRDSLDIGEELSADEEDRMIDLIGEAGQGHRLLGHALPVQDEMELDCQLVTNGLCCGDSAGYRDPRRAELEAGAKDWRLLLQIETDEEHSDMMWGDLGCLYFWIRQEDLLRRHFDDVWLILQCT